MIIYHSRFLIRGEVWFDNKSTPAQVDWILYHQRSEPLANGNWRRFYTLMLDLTQAPEMLLQRVDGFTASDIRKAQNKDLTSCRRLDPLDSTTFSHFIEFYDRFATLKQLGPADRTWLRRTAEAGKLDLWAAEAPQGPRLAYHVFYRDPRRVRSVHMASLYTEAASKEEQRKIGRANRLLVWTSLLEYQRQGVLVFDFGGWYSGKTNSALLGINKFKEAFGGKTVCEYEGEQLLTLKAWVVVKAARLLKKFKHRNASPAARTQAGSASGPTLAGSQAITN